MEINRNRDVSVKTNPPPIRNNRVILKKVSVVTHRKVGNDLVYKSRIK